MPEKSTRSSIHLAGESTEQALTAAEPSALDTFAGRVFVRWDPDANVTGFGLVAYFIEFLKTNGLWEIEHYHAVQYRRLIAIEVFMPPMLCRFFYGASDLNLKSVLLMNDLEAVARAVPVLRATDLVTINKGQSVPQGAIALKAQGEV
jgi:hypothetical protein